MAVALCSAVVPVGCVPTLLEHQAQTAHMHQMHSSSCASSPLLPAVPPVRSAHVPDASGQPNRAALPQLAPRPPPPAEVVGERQGTDPTSGSTRPKVVVPQRPVIGAGKVRRLQSLN